MSAEKRASRCGSLPPRRCLFLLLLLGAALFFFCCSHLKAPPEWSARFTQMLLPLGPNASSEAPPGAPDRLPTTPAAQKTVRTAAPYAPPGPYLVEYPHEYRFLVNPAQTCGRDKPFVVLLVHVAPHNRRHRDVIRSTWGGEELSRGKVVKVLFLLGVEAGERLHQQLLRESQEHGDLIQSDFLDSYKNLTIKTLVMLRWLDSFCREAAYAMKIDSDTFLHTHNLVGFLLNAPRTNYMTGLVAYGAAVVRDPESKWFLPLDLYPEPSFPPYALGMGYVLSLDLPGKLLRASRHVRALYIEDVYLGLCMKYLGVRPSDPPAQGYFHVFPLEYDRCAYSKIVVTTTHPSVDRVWLWEDFKRPGPYC